ncbi:hypothetical protein PUNSTDRAFT_44276 [Punctularia strigosozonata HHB-11173 SS5]|uniref:uncharacterized protein n=1 Tax=Punctularia strigosozonata (strain HHB-11173) TaxID=741275 RepID=UPI00044183A7|nr:uncharacterized protein PUNSTDRAFT_44276 [Punctularia strigosozonata HHB-11173 SS5]EIN08705.1 hypothetical protein PUNSTDRAFT_44276 [Punctularia strigosozonata HHB-11173 SS5]
MKIWSSHLTLAGVAVSSSATYNPSYSPSYSPPYNTSCSNSYDPDSVNASIPSYIDPVLQSVAADPPTSVSIASASFTNGIRTLPGAVFNFTELVGTTTGNLTVLKIDFEFPINLTSTNNIFAYHVHEFPISAGDDTCLSAGGHFDPFLANGTEGLVNSTLSPGLYHPSQGNLSTFQLGDLAGKYGVLTTVDGTVPPRTIYDHYLRLTGNFSVVGRSVVVHDAPTDIRLACGNITLHPLD